MPAGPGLRSAFGVFSINTPKAPKRRIPNAVSGTNALGRAHCQGYHPELLPKWAEALKRRHEIAARVEVRLPGMYSTLPEHREAAIAKADAPGQMAALVVQLLPGERAAIKVTPATPVEEMPAMAGQISGRWAPVESSLP